MHYLCEQVGAVPSPLHLLAHLLLMLENAVVLVVVEHCPDDVVVDGAALCLELPEVPYPGVESKDAVEPYAHLLQLRGDQLILPYLLLVDTQALVAVAQPVPDLLSVHPPKESVYGCEVHSSLGS